MKIIVHYFAVLRERTGHKSETFDLAATCRVEDVFEEMVRRHPSTAALRPALRAAVNQTFVAYDTPLQDGDEVVFIPPVSGGSGEILLTLAPLDVAAARDMVAASGHGAIVTFEGTVRDHRDGERVTTLEYEVYEAMALKTLAEIARRVELDHGVRVAIHHRYGVMNVGDTAVVIAVGAAHRAEAFEGCRAVIEALKAEVPIWKRETRPDGTVWVGLGP